MKCSSTYRISATSRVIGNLTRRSITTDMKVLHLTPSTDRLPGSAINRFNYLLRNRLVFRKGGIRPSKGNGTGARRSWRHFQSHHHHQHHPTDPWAQSIKPARPSSSPTLRTSLPPPPPLPPPLSPPPWPRDQPAALPWPRRRCPATPRPYGRPSARWWRSCGSRCRAWVWA